MVCLSEPARNLQLCLRRSILRPENDGGPGQTRHSSLPSNRGAKNEAKRSVLSIDPDDYGYKTGPIVAMMLFQMRR